MTARYRDPDLKNTIILDPFGVSDFPSDGYNPVAALDTGDDFPDDAMALAESMIRVEGRDPHWSASAQDLVCACIMAERLALGDKASLEGVRQVIGTNHQRFRTSIRRMGRLARINDCVELAIKAARYADIDSESRELNSILSAALTQTRWLDSRAIKSDLKKPNKIDFGQLKEKPTTVYLILPARRMGTHNVWMRVIIASILMPLLKSTARAKVPQSLWQAALASVRPRGRELPPRRDRLGRVRSRVACRASGVQPETGRLRD
jgi:type IV secretion system protein VirD4